MRLFVRKMIKVRGDTNIPVECYTLKEIEDVNLEVGKKYMIRDLNNKRNPDSMEWQTVICDYNFKRFISFNNKYYGTCIMKIDLLLGNYEVKEIKTKEILKFETKYKKN